MILDIETALFLADLTALTDPARLRAFVNALAEECVRYSRFVVVVETHSTTTSEITTTLQCLLAGIMFLHVPTPTPVFHRTNTLDTAKQIRNCIDRLYTRQTTWRVRHCPTVKDRSVTTRGTISPKWKRRDRCGTPPSPASTRSWLACSTLPQVSWRRMIRR